MRRPSTRSQFKPRPPRLPATPRLRPAPRRRPRPLPVLHCDWCGKTYIPDRQPRPGQGTFCTPLHLLKAWRARQTKVARPAAAQALPHVEALQESAPVEAVALVLEDLPPADAVD